MTASRRFYLVLIPGTLALALSCVAAPAQESTSPLVKQMYDGKWPDKASVARMYNELFYQNAIQAYILTLPTLNMIGMRDCSEAKFGKGYNILPIWKDR